MSTSNTSKQNIQEKEEEEEEEKKEEEMILSFYRDFCPIWLNERWIRILFIWILIIWILINFIIIINGIINNYNDNNNNNVIIEIWKIYELSTIYIWIEICFILTLSILSIYFNIKYFAKNHIENTYLRYFLLSLGCFITFCNIFGIISVLLISNKYLENVVKYLNYFIINVLSILIFFLCIFIMIKKIYIKYFIINDYDYYYYYYLLNSFFNKKNIMIQCVWCILFCNIIIFFQSMYTFKDNKNNKNNTNYYTNNKLQPIFKILIDSLLIFLSIFIIHRALIYQYIDYMIFNKFGNKIISSSQKIKNLIKFEIDKLLLNEYKLITFYSYFRLFLCLAPIADIITDIWTIYIYFIYNELNFAFISLLILFISFRFHTILWLLLKKRNAKFFIFNNNKNNNILISIWCLYIIPLISIFVNCIITIFLSSSYFNLFLLSIINEFILFFSPIICPLLIIYQSTKNFIFHFFLLKLKLKNVNKKKEIINDIFYSSGNIINKLNNIFDDEYDFKNLKFLKKEEIGLIKRIRCMKYCSIHTIPQFILQTLVLIFYKYFLNKFRLIQYLISAICSLFMLIQSCFHFLSLL